MCVEAGVLDPTRMNHDDPATMATLTRHPCVSCALEKGVAGTSKVLAP